jgi:hypothetical protein
MQAARKLRRSRGREGTRVSYNEQVRVEMEIFLYALDSYAERFAKNPELSFDEHCASLMAGAQVARSSGHSAREN